MLASAFFFSVMTFFVKYAGQRIPSHEIVQIRGIFMVIVTYGLIRRAGISPWGKRQNILWIRGVTGFAALTCFYYAVTHLPLATVTVLQYTSPIWTAVIAVPLLKEPITRRVVGAFVLSFAGIFAIARPSFLFGDVSSGLDLFAVGVALTSAFLSSGAYVATREAGKTERTLVIIFYFSLVSAVGPIPLALPVAIWPTPTEWLFLLGVGVATQVAQVFLTRGLRLVPAGRAMTIAYAQILFATFWGVLFFSEIPDVWTVIGALLVVAGTFIVSLGDRSGLSVPSQREVPHVDESSIREKNFNARAQSRRDAK
jgi:drug/metabolite transporter (DMT)-like permease